MSTCGTTPQVATLPATLPPLGEYKRDVHSQFGEDGIIAEILRRLGMDEAGLGRRLWCVEFGAWDGKHLSNTRHLIEQRDARAVLIEGCPKRYEELVENTRGFDGVVPIQRMIEWKGENSLFRILQGTELPERFDVLSIDVDGHDWFIWSSLRSYRATVVTVEYNPTMPYDLPVVPPYDPKQRWGCSLAALVALGREKGYSLAAVTDVNAIFVEDERFAALGLSDNSIKALTEGLRDFRTYLFQTQDGRVGVCGNQMMMWHQVMIDPAGMQPLPRGLRKHPEELGWFGRRWLGWLKTRRRRRWERLHAG